MRTYKKNFVYVVAAIFASSLLFNGCKKDEENPEPEDNNQTTAQMIFKCKINGEQFVATSIVTQGTSGIITAKGLKVSNGATPAEGSIQMTLSFGTNPAGELGLGAHQIVGPNFETANSPDNKNKAIFKDARINGLEAYVQSGSTVNVEQYYESSYWQGAKGTFNNVKFYTYTPAPEYKEDSVMITDGEFDVKYVVPGL
jgi:hypothetical protein